MRRPVENWQIAVGAPSEWSEVVPGGAKTAAAMMKALGRPIEQRYDAHEWWFKTTLAALPGETLVLEGIATHADVYLDGELLLSTSNMFRSHRVALPKESGELTIRCKSLDTLLTAKKPRPRWKAPMIENQQIRWHRTTLLGRTPGWSPPYAAVGPWAGVFLESKARPAIRVAIEGTTGVVTCGDERIEIPNVERWYPHTHGTPRLYDVTIGGVHRRVGFRTIEKTGDFAISVNGLPIFCRGACWTPDAISLRSTHDEYRNTLSQAAAAGMNMIRVGGTMVYEADDFYALADELGILIWQDFMFANMDYPEDEAFVGDVTAEATDFVARASGHACIAVLCGNSEGEQQAAMFGAPRERWAPPLFHSTLKTIAENGMPDVPYWPSSAHGGAFPHENRVGTTSYYGVSAYLRPLEDARRSEVRFATECLAFANIPENPPSGQKTHHAAWKERTPRDLTAGWDFEDVRDHYVKLLFGVDPMQVRYADHERYLALGRATVGEVMATTFGEWRRARSVCRGALVWFLKDLWAGAGWGVIGADGIPKSAYWAIKRSCAPLALHVSDEGTNGISVHIANDGAARSGELSVSLYRSGEIKVGGGTKSITLDAHSALEIPALELFDGFMDLTHAYRFGAPTCDLVVATFDGAEAFFFPTGRPSSRELDLGLSASAVKVDDGYDVTIATRRFAQSITFEQEGFEPSDLYFHLAPGTTRTIRFRGPGTLRGYVHALNCETPAKIAV